MSVGINLLFKTKIQLLTILLLNVPVKDVFNTNRLTLNIKSFACMLARTIKLPQCSNDRASTQLTELSGLLASPAFCLNLILESKNSYIVLNYDKTFIHSYILILKKG